MWDVLLNMYCFYELMNKAVSANHLAEQSPAGNLNRDREREQVESERSHVNAEGKKLRHNLTGKPQSRGDTQINRNGLL